jgi:hypothetical protein
MVLQTRSLNRFAHPMAQRRRLTQGRAFCVSHLGKHFSWGLFLPQNFRRVFYVEIEKFEYLLNT